MTLELVLVLVLVLTILSYDQQRALGPLDPTGLVAAHRRAGVAGGVVHRHQPQPVAQRRLHGARPARGPLLGVRRWPLAGTPTVTRSRPTRSS